MTKATDPAFTGPTDKGFTPGLTKLEYFAGQAMQGLLAGRKDNLFQITRASAIGYAELSHMMALELIKVLNKQS